MNLDERLNQVLKRICSDDFLAAKGIGNEVPFYIFDYPPEAELQIREYVQLFVDHFPRKRPDRVIKHVNLFDFVLDYLAERRLLDKCVDKQRAEGNAALLGALKGVLSEEKVAARFETVVEPASTDLILVSGVGSVYPMIRSHSLLNNLHTVLARTPLVLFYPGKYDGTALKLFGKTGLSSGQRLQRGREANYYRAFPL